MSLEWRAAAQTLIATTQSIDRDMKSTRVAGAGVLDGDRESGRAGNNSSELRRSFDYRSTEFVRQRDAN
ncbi:MAG: hypothetical protein CMJ64_07910 [Planctomycetaceae bacterium]|nr:hypothetical protein [Planctomycetaceae bacterium]